MPVSAQQKGKDISDPPPCGGWLSAVLSIKKNIPLLLKIFAAV